MCRWVLIFVCTMYLYVLDVRVRAISVRLFAVHRMKAVGSVRMLSVFASLCVQVCSVFCVCVYMCICNVGGEMHPE